MGKTGKWFKSFLTGKKDRDKESSAASNQNNASGVNENSAARMSNLPTIPKEKRRWSFRRSSSTAAAAEAPSKGLNCTETAPTSQPLAAVVDNEKDEQKKLALAVAAAAQAAAAAASGRAREIEEAAAIKIQSVFRAYLARKALCALKGLVKLQALVRGHLVRKQATATLRCMQALVTLQARAVAQRLQAPDETKPPANPTQSIHRKSTQENRFRHGCSEMDRGMEEKIKIVEMDHGELSRGSTKSRNSCSSHPLSERAEHRFSAYYPSNHGHNSRKENNYDQISPAPSGLKEMSPRACSGHFEDYYSTAQSSPQCCYSAVSKPDPSRVPFAFPLPDYEESLSNDYPLFPNYMANTESSRAKARSQSAPKSRPADAIERQPSVRRRASIEGRSNIPRAVRMQRSSSHLGSAAQNIQCPWSIKLDRSVVSLKDSECGSTTSTVLTGTNYCRSLVAYDHHGNRY